MTKVAIRLEIDGEVSTISSEGGAVGAIHALNAALTVVLERMGQHVEGVRG